METQPLLSVQLSAGYRGKPAVLKDVCFEMQRGEVLSLVGQSGCGKSTLALAILRLLHWKQATAEGRIVFNGRDLMAAGEREMRAMRGREIALVLQSPLSALNPARRIGAQLEEAWQIHRRTSVTERLDAVHATLRQVSLPGDRAFLRRYPAELSVGQAQRVLIGMAILHRPALLIADEPTSALDIVTQAEILELFSRLSQDLGIAILYISHDLLSVAAISNRVAVMDQGRIVECQPTARLFTRPAHPFTQKLIAALPAVPQFGCAAQAQIA